MTELPNELVDVICLRPGIWPNCRSSGAVTDGRHHVRTRARIERGDLDRRIVHFRQRRDGQLLVRDAARQ